MIDFEPNIEIVTEPPVDTTMELHMINKPSRRKKSLLCNVYTPSDFEEDDSTTTQTTQPTRWSFLRRCSWLPSKKRKGQTLIEYNEPSHSNEYNDKSTAEPLKTKRVSWLSSLLQKRQEKSKVKSTKEPFRITNFLRSKKRKQQKEKVAAIPELPKRYPIQIESVIYRLATMRLSESGRPFRDQLLTTNMLNQYHRILQSHNELVFNGSFQLVSSLLYQQQQLHVVN